MTNLKKIYALRYQKTLLFLSGLILFVYGYSSVDTMKDWQWRDHYYHSEEFINEFEESLDTRIRDYDEKGQPIYYNNIKEFQDTQLTLFQHYPESSLYYTGAAIPSRSVYYPGKTYTSNSSYFVFLFPIVFLAGFALFFVDQKTNFNRLLFTLPVSRKRLFLDKLRYIALPFAGVLALGSFLQILFYMWGFPSEYVNASFFQMLYSGFSHWLLLILAFAIGLFLGVLLNHLILAPTLIILGFFAFLLVSDFYRNFAWIINHYFPKVKFYDLDGIFVIWPGKTASPWWIILMLGCAIALFLFLSYVIFKHLSLENTGQLLSVPDFKLPVFITLFLLTSIWFNLGLWDIGYRLSANLRLPYEEVALTILLCLSMSFGLIYYPEIYKKWQNIQKKIA